MTVGDAMTDCENVYSALEAAVARGDSGPTGAVILDALRKWADYCGDGPPAPEFIKTIEQARNYTLVLTNLQKAVADANAWMRQHKQRKAAGLS